MADTPHSNASDKALKGAATAPAPGRKIRFSKNASGAMVVEFIASDSPINYELDSLKRLLLDSGFDEAAVKSSDLARILEKFRAGDFQPITLEAASSGVSLTLDYDPQSRTLFADIAASDGEEALNFARLKREIDTQGYGAFTVANSDLSNLALKAQQKKYGRYAIGRKPDFTQVNFSLDEDSGDLYADLSAAEEQCYDSPSAIEEELSALGYLNFHFEPHTVAKLFNQISKNERGRFVIGQKRDAQVSISLDDDLMTARLSVSPPMGGRELSEALLEKAIADAGIFRECCDHKTLKKVLETKHADNLPFAYGTEPMEGVDASFEALVEEVEYAIPKGDKSGRIDVREIVNFTLIEANVALMRRKPARPGVNGRDVKGHVIPATEAIDAPFDDKLVGAIISPDDPNLLISTCKGHPVVSAHGVKVDNSIVLNNVDLSTGNIDYDGSVLVKGEVKAGMKIKVSGDIIVKGVVTKATLLAKNNITVECGIIGSDPSKDGKESPPAILKAGGTIRAQYINLAEVYVTGDLEVKEYISHCQVQAKGQIKAGAQGGKGRIFGGTNYAQSGIFAVSLGASGGIKTNIVVGAPADQLKQFEQLKQTFQSRQDKEQKLQIMLKKYEAELLATPNDRELIKKTKAITTLLVDLRTELKKMALAVDKLSTYFKSAKDVDVRVSTSTYPNVILSVNGSEFMIRQESKGGIFARQGKDVRWLNFTAK